MSTEGEAAHTAAWWDRCTNPGCALCGERQTSSWPQPADAPPKPQCNSPYMSVRVPAPPRQP